MSINALADKVRAGGRLTDAEALDMYLSAPTHLLGLLANEVRQKRHPDRTVTYIIDRNVNYTNVCVARCSFCAFYRPVGSPDGYVLGFDEIVRKIDETIELGGGQLLLQGGHNPDLPLEWYEDLFREVKSRYPTFRLHALSPPEVLHISRLAQMSVPDVVRRLVAAGLDSIPGGGAEILVDRVRTLLHCYTKASADEWIDVMRHAHRAGLRTTATMMFGTVETPAERIEHMSRLRALQDETSGFTAFIAWSYQPEHTELQGVEATAVEYLRTIATARLFLDNFPSLQASWVTQGGKVGQLSLTYGANDMGSVMIEENVVRAAGAAYCMDEIEIVRNIEDAGFEAKRRNMHYEVLGGPIFRERQVPRMLELAVARADGDTAVPAELVNYPARSRAERKRRARSQVYRTMSPDLAVADHKPWWKGARGEWFVVAQVVLIGLVFLGPRTLAGGPAWPFPFPHASMVVGAALVAAGGVLLGAGFVRLGSGLTALPHPKDGAELVETGAFGLVRHPIYSGLLVAGFGWWALFVQGWLTLAYVAVLFVVLDMKARREERWLVEKFPAYAAYQLRVRRFIPFVY